MTHTIYLYVFDTMSDWEIGYLTAELNSGRYFKKGIAPYNVVTVGLDSTPVTTMGGLKITPDRSLDSCKVENTDALILPGGNTWTESIHQPILKFASECLDAGLMVAGICGATMGMAQYGILNSRKHTSNDLGYLKMICPNYEGEAQYLMESAVTDGPLITARGIAPIEFAAHVINGLGVFDSETLEAWVQLNKTQDIQYFFELMASVQ